MIFVDLRPKFRLHIIFMGKLIFYGPFLESTRKFFTCLHLDTLAVDELDARDERVENYGGFATRVDHD